MGCHSCLPSGADRPRTHTQGNPGRRPRWLNSKTSCFGPPAFTCCPLFTAPCPAAPTSAQHLHYLPTIHRGPVQMITRSCDLLLKTSTGFPKYSEENPILFYHGPQRTVIWGLLSTLTSPRTAITCSLHTQVSSYFRAFALASPRGCAPDFTWPTPSCQSCLNPNVTSGEASANHPEHCQPLVLSWALFPPDSVSCCLCLTWRGRPALGQQRPHRLSSLSLLRSARWFSTTSWWTC